MMTQEEYEKTIAWAKVVAGCVVEKDGKYLLVQEKQKKVYGLWNLPAGHVDKDEAIEHAAVREAKEETGYDVALDNKIAIYHESVDRPIKHVFAAHIVGGDLRIDPEEILDAKWLTFDEVKDLDGKGQLRVDFIIDAIEKTRG